MLFGFEQRGALVAPPARSSTRFDFCNKIFDQLYLQLAPAIILSF